MDMASLAGDEAETLRQRIRECWGCEVTPEYAQALLRFIDDTNRHIAELEQRLSERGVACPE